MFRLLLVLIALAVSGCQGESARPSPTGKGSVRMINGLDAGPEVGFFVEERFQETVRFGAGSATISWDDFSYVFNFQANVVGQSEANRFASVETKIDVDQETTLVLTGTIDNPTVSVWNTPERTFTGTETVFEARIAHLSPTAGPTDFYLVPSGSDPVPGEQLGTLDFGEFLDPIDIEEANYTLTVTESGNPANVLFQASEGTYVAQTVSTFALFDGTEIDTAPHVVQLIGVGGGAGTITDSRFGPTVRIFQASISLPAADVYDDEALTSLVLPNHQFGDISGELPIPAGTTSYIYTAAGNTSVELLRTGITASTGLPYNLVVVGDDDFRAAQTYVPNRRSVSTESRLQFFQASSNFPLVDIYTVDRNAGFTGEGRVIRRLELSLQGSVLFDTRNIDVYVTPLDEETVLAGPVPLDLTLGDVVELLILDTVDPSTVELRLVPAPE